jgi:RimJ/RimL family protein N-acetyltransferase
MLLLVVDRPIFAMAATDNIGSIRVLEKCGFKIIGKKQRLRQWQRRRHGRIHSSLDLDQASVGAR